MTKHRCRDKESSAGSHRERIVRVERGTWREGSTFSVPEAKSDLPGRRMNPSDIQSESEPRYFDPEEVDMSEQQFAASLDISIREEKPQFVRDDVVAEGRGDDCQAMNSASAAPGEPSIGNSIEKQRLLEVPEVSEAALPENAQQSAHESDADWRELGSAEGNRYKGREAGQETYSCLERQVRGPPAR